jgi:hypothetical protein
MRVKYHLAILNPKTHAIATMSKIRTHMHLLAVGLEAF